MLIYFREEDCSPFDIGLVYSTIARFSDTDKFRFIQNIWKADVGYEFPVLWLVRFPWLAYSKYVDGAFCLPCVCFGMECGKNGSRLDKLFRSPLTFWTTAISRLQSHSCGKSETHNFFPVAMANFKDVMARRAVPIFLKRIWAGEDLE